MPFRPACIFEVSSWCGLSNKRRLRRSSAEKLPRIAPAQATAQKHKKKDPADDYYASKKEYCTNTSPPRLGTAGKHFVADRRLLSVKPDFSVAGASIPYSQLIPVRQTQCLLDENPM